MNKLILLLAITLILIGCNTNITQSTDQVQFSSVDSLEDAEYVIFNWYEEPNVSNRSFTLYHNDERKIGLIEDLQQVVVSEGNLDLHEMGIGSPNTYILGIMHDSSANIYTTIEVNHAGELFIYNRYTAGENPAFYKSSGNLNIYEKVQEIIEGEKDKEQSQSLIEDIDFEYKEKTPIGTSIFEIRSEEGQLIADVSDIDKDSVKVVMDETDHPLVEIRFIDEEFVFRFTGAHIGEETRIYVNGELVSSPRIMEPIMSNSLVITGNFDNDMLNQMVSQIQAE